MYMNTLDSTLQFEDRHLLVRTIIQYYHIHMIKISTSKNYSPCPYHLHDSLVTVSRMNKVAINSEFTMAGLPILMMQPNHVHQASFFCLSLDFLLWKICLTFVYENEHTRSRTQA